MELLSLTQISFESKLQLLKELGYESDGLFVLDSKRNRVLDRYTQEPVKVTNMLIVPGSIIILDNNPLSVAAYLEEFGDVF